LAPSLLIGVVLRCRVSGWLPSTLAVRASIAFGKVVSPVMISDKRVGQD
jgi:hypothetical protein